MQSSLEGATNDEILKGLAQIQNLVFPARDINDAESAIFDFRVASVQIKGFCILSQPNFPDWMKVHFRNMSLKRYHTCRLETLLLFAFPRELQWHQIHLDDAFFWSGRRFIRNLDHSHAMCEKRFKKSFGWLFRWRCWSCYERGRRRQSKERLSRGWRRHNKRYSQWTRPLTTVVHEIVKRSKVKSLFFFLTKTLVEDVNPFFHFYKCDDASVGNCFLSQQKRVVEWPYKRSPR